MTACSCGEVERKEGIVTAMLTAALMTLGHNFDYSVLRNAEISQRN